MPSGLAFVQKPALFIEHSSISKVQFSSSPRYVELEVEFLESGTDDTRSVSFSMIDRNEEIDLENYLHLKEVGEQEACKPSAKENQGSISNIINLPSNNGIVELNSSPHATGETAHSTKNKIHGTVGSTKKGRCETVSSPSNGSAEKAHKKAASAARPEKSKAVAASGKVASVAAVDDAEDDSDDSDWVEEDAESSSSGAPENCDASSEEDGAELADCPEVLSDDAATVQRPKRRRC
jgi:hypothetical protein